MPDQCGSDRARWVRTSVEMLDHPILNVGPYSRRDAWLWLIAHAAWRDKRVNHKGRPLDLKRGQVLVGRAFLAETWGWGEKQVRIFLELLVADNMLEKGQSNGHFANVVTICNYDKYQSVDHDEKPVQGPEQGQSAASAGPEQGQTLTKDTSNTKGTKIEDSDADASECTSAPVGDQADKAPPRKPPEPQPVMEAFEAYLAVAAEHGLSQPRTLTPAMRKSIGARLREHTPGGWQDMLDGLAASDFLRGKNERGWRANLDWIVKPANFSKIVSGNYDNRESTEYRYGQSSAKHPLLSALDDLSDRLASVN